MIHQYRMRVYIEDTDAAGIVYHANYLSFCARARIEWAREMGYEYGQMYKDGLALPVTSANLTYKAPAFLDDELSVQSQIIEVSRVSLVFSQRVKRYNTDELLCEAIIKLVCVDRNMRPQRVPEILLKGVK